MGTGSYWLRSDRWQKKGNHGGHLIQAMQSRRTNGLKEELLVLTKHSAISESTIRATLQSASSPGGSWTASTMTLSDVFGTN